jgi:hypothetical protein
MTNRMVMTTLALSVVTALGSAPSALTHPGHAHTIMGTITSARDGQVEVVDSNKETTTFTITKVTKILVGKIAGTQKDLRAGLRIVVEAEEKEDETFIATKIQLPARVTK